MKVNFKNNQYFTYVFYIMLCYPPPITISAITILNTNGEGWAISRHEIGPKPFGVCHCGDFISCQSHFQKKYQSIEGFILLTEGYKYTNDTRIARCIFSVELINITRDSTLTPINSLGCWTIYVRHIYACDNILLFTFTSYKDGVKRIVHRARLYCN